jgi:lactoylglutathione lyase
MHASRTEFELLDKPIMFDDDQEAVHRLRAPVVLVGKGVTILRPPRDGYMAFVRSPDGISVELLQDGPPLEPAEPWKSMPNIGEW